MVVMSQAQFARRSARAMGYLSRKLNLFEYRLPAGDCGSINIGWGNNGAQIKLDPSLWIGKRSPDGKLYDGLHLIGDGKTSLRCTSWDGITLAVKRHDGVVQVSGVDWYAGYRALTQFGEQNFDGKYRTVELPGGGTKVELIPGTQKIACPKFQLRCYGSRWIAPPPSDLNGQRGMWAGFGYNFDEHLEDVEMHCEQLRQHPDYHHGAALHGWYWNKVKGYGSAGEYFKVRSDATETAWAGDDVWAIVRNSSMEDLGQAWSDYGGCGINLQGAACHALIEDSLIRGRLGAPHCIMVSAEGMSYDLNTGALVGGDANGCIVVRNTGLTGAAQNFDHNEVMNVYPQGGNQNPCQALLVQGVGTYGRNSQLGLSGVPKGQCVVEKSNTPQIKERARSLGIDTTYETVIATSQRLVPVSEGFKR